MIKKLIELDAALSAIGEVPTYNDGMVFEALSHAQRDVALLPTVDAVPVEHGKWEKHKGIFICSSCWTGYKEQPTMMGKPLFEFCPVCGAKMDGKDDDHEKAD